MSFEWQSKKDENPVLAKMDLLALKEALADAFNRIDVRIKEFNMEAKDDHVFVSLKIEVR
jgi:REP element-mobilizing transposase RayT